MYVTLTYWGQYRVAWRAVTFPQGREKIDHIVDSSFFFFFLTGYNFNLKYFWNQWLPLCDIILCILTITYISWLFSSIVSHLFNIRSALLPYLNIRSCITTLFDWLKIFLSNYPWRCKIKVKPVQHSGILFSKTIECRHDAWYEFWTNIVDSRDRSLTVT